MLESLFQWQIRKKVSPLRSPHTPPPLAKKCPNLYKIGKSFTLVGQLILLGQLAGAPASNKKWKVTMKLKFKMFYYSTTAKNYGYLASKGCHQHWVQKTVYFL